MFFMFILWKQQDVEQTEQRYLSKSPYRYIFLDEKVCLQYGVQFGSKMQQIKNKSQPLSNSRKVLHHLKLFCIIYRVEITMKRGKNISRMSRLKSARWVGCVDNDVSCTVYRSHKQQHQFTFLQDRNRHICIFCNLNRIKIILNELKRTELKLVVLVTNLPTEN